MKKKLLYGIFFVSIFLLSTATMVQPVRGYEFGVPDEAVGVTTNGEIKIFDEDEVDKHLGAGVDLDGNLHGGDSDVVGARSQTLYGEIEKDEEIDYLNDYVAKPAGIPESFDGIDLLLASMCANMSVWPAGTYGPVAWLANYSIHSVFYSLLGGGYLGGALDANIIQTLTETGSVLANCYNYPDYAYFKALYSKDYDGVILNRETWEYHEDHADLDDDADDDDDPAPFFADPRDWADVARNIEALENDVGTRIDGIQDHWADLGNLVASLGMDPTGAGWYGQLLYLCLAGGATGLGHYATINATIAGQIAAIPATNTVKIINKALFGTCKPQTIPLSSYLLGAMGVENNLSAKFGLPGGSLPEWQVDYVIGLMGLGDLVFESVYAEVKALIPDRAGFFLGQLIAGQPAQTPSSDFMTKVIDEYYDWLDDDGETLYDMYGFEYGEDLPDENGCYDGEVSAVPVGAVSRFTGTDLGGETIYPQAYMEFEWDGSAVIAEIEWIEDYIDPKDRTIFGGDNEDELKDFEIEFPYGDTGGQGTVSYMDGDEIFWQLGGVDQIPGFEISILLGASAIAILGLIYIIMKKRKM